MTDTGFINRCRTWFRSFWQRVRGIESKWTWYEIDARNNMVKINKAPNLFMTLQWIVIMSFKVSCHFHASCLKCHCTYELILTKAFRYMIKIMICHCVITREGDWPLHIGPIGNEYFGLFNTFNFKQKLQQEILVKLQLSFVWQWVRNT